MEQPTTGTDPKAWLKLAVILVVLLALPEYFELASGSFIYSCVLFTVGSVVYVMQLPALGSGSLAPQLIFLALLDSVPGMMFFLRIHGPNQTGPVKRSLIGAVIGTFLVGMFLAIFWPFFSIAGPIDYYRFLLVANGYPAYALVGLVFIPFLCRESSFLLPVKPEPGQETGTVFQSSFMASRRAALSLGLVLGVATFSAPMIMVIAHSWYFSSLALVSTTASLGTSLYSVDFYSSAYAYYSVWSIPAFAAILALSSLRIIFARKLLLYCRGIGRRRRVLAIGVVGEALAISPYVIVFLFAYAYYLVFPLPFLPVIGSILMKLRGPVAPRAVTGEIWTSSGDSVWPLTFEEEQVVFSARQRSREDPVKVPFAYVLLSRIRKRFLRSGE